MVRLHINTYTIIISFTICVLENNANIRCMKICYDAEAKCVNYVDI